MRARLVNILVLTLGVFGAGLIGAPVAHAAVTAALPGQILTVRVATPTATTAQVELWQLTASRSYLRIWGPAPGWVGELGVGTTRDSVPRTPAGMFGLTQAFGNQPNNGTNLPYFQADSLDWWNGEAGSPAYNTHVRQAVSPGPNSENLYYTGAAYAHAVVINYNMNPAVPGAGAAFFLHVSNGQPTAGCVSLISAHLDQVMRRLDPARHPMISIGVGNQATWYVNQINASSAKHNPRGHFDVGTTAGAGKVRLAGWAADPDNVSAQLGIEVLINSRRYTWLHTGTPRPDVAAIAHTGPNQGFDALVAVPAGTQTVCLRAYNISIGTDNLWLGCRTLTVP
jgi:L,D-peptidoglycan transpeptidase YkuD (ErfK/YbiS/YcfS/YnhG family)